MFIRRWPWKCRCHAGNCSCMHACVCMYVCVCVCVICDIDDGGSAVRCAVCDELELGIAWRKLRKALWQLKGNWRKLCSTKKYTRYAYIYIWMCVCVCACVVLRLRSPSEKAWRKWAKNQRRRKAKTKTVEEISKNTLPCTRRAYLYECARLKIKSLLLFANKTN